MSSKGNLLRFVFFLWYVCWGPNTEPHQLFGRLGLVEKKMF